MSKIQITFYKEDGKWLTQGYDPATGDHSIAQLPAILPTYSEDEVEQVLLKHGHNLFDNSYEVYLGEKLVLPKPEPKVEQPKKLELPKEDNAKTPFKATTLEVFAGVNSVADLVRLLEQKSPFTGEFTLFANKAVEHTIVRIYQRQTQDERKDRQTKHSNGVGFRGNHGRVGTYYARWILGKVGPNKSGNRLSGRHLAKARAMAKQYRKQMFDIICRLREKGDEQAAA